MSETKKGPLPLVIGFTGHRDLREEDIPHLEAQVRSVLLDFQERFPSTPLVVLSALAEGADRLGARVALEIGYQLIVPLPMPADVYITDFDEESLKDYHGLLARSGHHFDLPLMEGCTLESISVSGPTREKQYAAGGAYIATHCQILIALWNGVPLNLIGGTSQVVRFKLDGVPEPYAPPHSELDAPESGPVYHIVTPRKRHQEVDGRPYSLHKKFPLGFRTVKESEKAYEDIFGRIEEFNQDALINHENLKEKRAESKEYIISLKLRTHLTARQRATLDLYAEADALSQHFQGFTGTTLRVLLIMVFAAALSFDMYTHFFESEHIFLVGFLLSFVVAFVWNYRANRAGYQTKYLDYRALAEGLRVQFFWQLAEMKDSVADYYLRKQKSELDWIRHAARTTMTETEDDPDIIKATHPGLLHCLGMVEKHWVEDQMKYFAKAANRDHDKYHRNEKVVKWLFTSSLFLAFIQIFIEHNKVVVLGIGLLPVIGAIIQTFTDTSALSEHTKQYERMAVLFRRAKHHLRTIIDDGRIPDAQHFIAELGKEALIENGDWIVTHRERPLEVPKGA